MSGHHGSNRARQEQLKRRKEFYKNFKNPRPQRSYRKTTYDNSSSFLNMEFHIWRVRRWGPFVLAIHVFTVLCFLGWLFFSGTHLVDTTNCNVASGDLGIVEVPDGGEVYNFEVSQVFPATEAPLYSELEIEILDSKMDHMYSVYKDLWQERHSNGEGGRSIYSDLRMEFEIELPEKGTYFIRPIPYNDNLGYINVRVSKRRFGNIYFKYYAITFGILSFILLIGSGLWGDVTEMWSEMIKKKTYKNRQSQLFAGALLAIFIGIFIINISHYGYAKAGEETRLPTWFYSNGDVYYLG